VIFLNFSELIKKRRLELNLTPTDVAYKTRLSASYISCLETGSRPSPSPDKAFILAEALNLSPEELIWMSVIEKLPENMKKKLRKSLLKEKEEKVSISQAIDADKELSDYSKKTLKDMYNMLQSTDVRQKEMMKGKG